MTQTLLTQRRLDEPIDNLLSVYTGNGNIIGVLLLSQEFFSGDDYKNDSELRKSLASWGQCHSIDSIMVLTGNPALCQEQGYHFSMDVFEPQGDDHSGMTGGWSSMCGNGLMAVSLFFEDIFEKISRSDQILIQTRSGLRISTKVGNGRYSVCMGEFTHKAKDLRKYVNQLLAPEFEWFQSSVSNSIPLDFSKIWSIGLSGNKVGDGCIDGEPHVVMLKQANGEKMDIFSLRDIAIQQGPLVTKNSELFPQEINVSFAVVQSVGKTTLRVIACTHERGLGNDPRHSVTDACGTGATAIAATLYKAYNLEDGIIVDVQMPGGLLQVYRHGNQFHLIGSAQKLENNYDKLWASNYARRDPGKIQPVARNRG